MLCLAAAIFAGPAGAVVEKPGPNKVGVQPHEVAGYTEGTAKWNGQGKNESEPNASAKSFGNPGGNAVLHGANTYVVYWDPQDYYHGDWQALIDGFLANAGASNGQLASVFALDAQYTDASNQPATSRSSFRGAYTDTTAYPPSECEDPQPFTLGAPLTNVCLTDAQLRTQLQTFIAQHSLPRGMSTIYYLLTPPGVAVCLDTGGATGHCSDFAGTIKEVEEAEAKKEVPSASYRNSFCSYHGAIGEGSPSTILFAAIPWTAGGEGDNHLAAKDATPAYACQDGGFEPGKKVNGELQEKEKVKAKTALEEEEFANKNAQEKREQKEAEELGLQGPHQQEPNQRGPERTPDGGYDTGLADLEINQIAVEQQNIVTDPLLNGWQDPTGAEVTDECRNLFALSTGGSVTANPYTRAGTLANQVLSGANYYLNDTFDMASLRLPYPGVPCMTGIDLVPAFTSPNPVKSGEIVGFDGMESNITLDATVSYPSETNTYATFTWDFGDGSPTVSGYAPGAASLNSPSASPCEAPWLTPCAASTFHSYQYGGTYTVTLTVKDVGGNTASITKNVTVEGPPPPAPASQTSTAAAPGTNGSTSGGTTSGGTTASGANGSTTPQPQVVATQAVVSTKLSSALRSGLVVRYSVSQQVAGRFEVLLASSIARRIRLHGPSATGLAKGTPPQTVIAKAILVTTKGGRGTYKITFSKTTASRLRKLHKVTLMIRLVVHNATSPVATTVLNTVNLH
jgi:PKD repeat protein